MDITQSLINYVYNTEYNIPLYHNYIRLNEFVNDPKNNFDVSEELLKVLPLSMGDRVVIFLCKLLCLKSVIVGKLAKIAKAHFDFEKLPPPTFNDYAFLPGATTVSFHPEGRPILREVGEDKVETLKRLAEKYKMNYGHMRTSRLPSYTMYDLETLQLCMGRKDGQ